jgi:hypothetical protein
MTRDPGRDRPRGPGAIEAISGLAFAERVGQAWNDADAEAIAEFEEAGIEIHPAGEAVLGTIRDAVAAEEKAWAARLPEAYDGAAVAGVSPIHRVACSDHLI